MSERSIVELFLLAKQGMPGQYRPFAPLLIIIILVLTLPVTGFSFEYINKRTDGSLSYRCITNSSKQFNLKKIGFMRYMVTGDITKVVYGSSYNNVANKICNQ